MLAALALAPVPAAVSSVENRSGVGIGGASYGGANDAQAASMQTATLVPSFARRLIDSEPAMLERRC
jgi:hypothetical protein